jgi:hypothetical protein
MLDVARDRTPPPTLEAPPEWVTRLDGFDRFRVHRSDQGWSAWPEGMDEHVELPGGTWRVTLVMPVDLTLIDGSVDPLLLLVALADGAAKVEDKIQELVLHCRAAGKSWTQIGQALGMTKQSAWERFSGED